ncbi:MAG: hypothetical protein BECKG1743D_GA0114223_101047 [Candidatus Kentron sp. G]|nr:MAG: hypothetical protein BECKG1743D_GA0114223_101047 [Candidatus Kentron sp. G]VFM99502.1 MAG: hypothetical protein BECKG1743F_GA0114225_104037 [Candidatus Kentron sp. G]VFN01118.1 MAG: hypothetical protein BECKG1743E_GA0114224_103832 [Candidatus Kentron sp. G]
MTRAGRLASATATQWVRNYTGKNLVCGYCKWFAVDPLCAVIELRALGAPISAEREEQLRRSAERKSKDRAARKRQRAEDRDEYPDSDGTFAYIAGYTPAGFPYGVTWEELGQEPPWL